MKNFIETISDDQRIDLVKTTLETMFKKILEIKFIERKEYNIPGLERSVYWVYGFRCEMEDSFMMQAATIDDRGYIDLRFHPVKINVGDVKDKNFKFNS